MIPHCDGDKISQCLPSMSLGSSRDVETNTRIRTKQGRIKKLNMCTTYSPTHLLLRLHIRGFMAHSNQETARHMHRSMTFNNNNLEATKQPTRQEQRSRQWNDKGQWQWVDYSCMHQHGWMSKHTVKWYHVPQKSIYSMTPFYCFFKTRQNWTVDTSLGYIAGKL